MLLDSGIDIEYRGYNPKTFQNRLIPPVTLLEHAIRACDDFLVSFLLKQYSRLSSKNIERPFKWSNLLNSAIEEANFLIVSGLIQHLEDQLEEKEIAIGDRSYIITVYRGEVEILDLLISKRPQAFEVLKKTPWILFELGAQSNRIDMLRALKQQGLDIYETNYLDQGSPLALALFHHKMETAEFLLEHEVNINSYVCGLGPERTWIIDTRLPYLEYRVASIHCAVMNGNVQFVDRLISKGGDVNQSGKMLPIQFAVGYRNIEMVQLLLDKGAHPNTTSLSNFGLHNDDDYETFKPFHNDLEKVYDFPLTMSPMLMALELGDEPIYDLLKSGSQLPIPLSCDGMRKKSDLCINHDLKNSGSHCEAEYCALGLEPAYSDEELKDYDDEFDDERVWNPLLNAAYGKNKNLFSQVLEIGIKSNRQWMTKRCFSQCTKSFDLEFITNLLARNVFDLSPSYRVEMLSLVIMENAEATFKDIIHNQNHELKSKDIQFAFESTIAYGRQDMMRILLDSGYWPDASSVGRGSELGEDPYYWDKKVLLAALNSKCWPIKKAILDHYQRHATGFQGSTVKPHFMTAYNTALKGGHIDMAKILASETVSSVGTYMRCRVSGRCYFSAVWTAAYYMQYDFVLWLLDQNVIPDFLEDCDKVYHSTLQYASIHGEAQVVKRLLEKGANPNAKPARYHGRTAVQFAAMKGHFEILNILIRAGADINAPCCPFDGRPPIEAAAEKKAKWTW